MSKARKHEETQRSTTTLHIKNMVCNRCIRVVKEELERLGVNVHNVVLGEAVVEEAQRGLPLNRIRTVLEANGFELIEDRRAKIIEKIKHAIIKLIENDREQGPMRRKLSEHIAREVGYDYHYLSTLFSSVEGITIEQYLILQKIEKVKELLKYGELTLSEISYKMSYSSVQHLSNQFKKVTGMTPSTFKSMTQNLRRPIDRVVH